MAVAAKSLNAQTTQIKRPLSAATRKEVVSLKKLFVLACVVSVMAVIAISASSAFAGLVNDPAVCGPMGTVNEASGGAIADVYGAACG